MAIRISRRSTLLIKIESSEGVDATPGATDAVRMAADWSLDPDWEFPNTRDDAANGGVMHRIVPAPPEGRYARLSGTVELRGAGTAYAAGVKPELDAILRMAGMAAAGSFTGAAERWDYTPGNTSLETGTVYVYQDGKLFKLLGAVAEVSFTLTAGQKGMANVSITGLYTAGADTSFVAGTYVNVIPPRNVSATFAYNSVALVKRESTYTLGNGIVSRPNANAADALAGYAITTRTMVWSARVEDPLVATAALEGDADAATTRAIAEVLGTIQYNRVKFDMDAALIQSYKPTSENGILIANIGGGIFDKDTAVTIPLRIRYD